LGLGTSVMWAVSNIQIRDLANPPPWNYQEVSRMIDNEGLEKGVELSDKTFLDELEPEVHYALSTGGAMRINAVEIKRLIDLARKGLSNAATKDTPS